jgi:transposase
MQVTTTGLDLAKRWFQVHGVDDVGAVCVRRCLRRSEVNDFFATLPPFLIGMEACASAHYWARELMRLGHEVKLMPPTYVKAYVKSNKNDAADAEAICEAVTRTFDALRTGKGRKSTIGADVAPDPSVAGPSAHDVGQRAAPT